jgi:hypothetical protein
MPSASAAEYVRDAHMDTPTDQNALLHETTLLKDENA